jgi:hypothetical protein
MTSALAATLRQELGMQLFNFDLIVPEEQLQPHGPADVARNRGGSSSSSSSLHTENAAPALCYVVDINYFPGGCSNKDLAPNTGA